MDFEILDYLPTPAEKYAGIVRVKATLKGTFRFKIQPRKDGAGHFPAVASIKGPDENNAASYLPSFVIDSASEREDLDHAIGQAIKRFVDPASVHNVAESKAIPIDKEAQRRQNDLRPQNTTLQQRSSNGEAGRGLPVDSGNGYQFENEKLPF